MTVLVLTLGGNFHSATDYLNKHKLGGYLRQMSFTGNYTQTVLVVPDELLPDLREREIIR